MCSLISKILSIGAKLINRKCKIALERVEHSSLMPDGKI